MYRTKHAGKNSWREKNGARERRGGRKGVACAIMPGCVNLLLPFEANKTSHELALSLCQPRDVLGHHVNVLWQADVNVLEDITAFYHSISGIECHTFPRKTYSTHALQISLKQTHTLVSQLKAFQTVPHTNPDLI